MANLLCRPTVSTGFFSRSAPSDWQGRWMGIDGVSDASTNTTFLSTPSQTIPVIQTKKRFLQTRKNLVVTASARFNGIDLQPEEVSI